MIRKTEWSNSTAFGDSICEFRFSESVMAGVRPGATEQEKLRKEIEARRILIRHIVTELEHDLHLLNTLTDEEERRANLQAEQAEPAPNLRQATNEHWGIRVDPPVQVATTANPIITYVFNEGVDTNADGF